MSVTAPPASSLHNPALPEQVAVAVRASGLEVLAIHPAIDFFGNPTTRFTLARSGNPAPTQQLELSQTFQPGSFDAAFKTYLDQAAIRLRNPRPDCYLTLTGIPVSFSPFSWPFHESSAGADTSLVHGQIALESNPPGVPASPLHARIAAAMTTTFREIVPAPEQPFCEAFLINAIRKTLDQGQLELVKSGNRQPVPITTRFYSVKQGRYIFNDTTATLRERFLAAKLFWLSAILGGNAPVWLTDPRDAQYLNTSEAELQSATQALAAEGLLTAHDGFATPTEALIARHDLYHADLAQALAFIKPTFNEQMRAGQTNM